MPPLKVKNRPLGNDGVLERSAEIRNIRRQGRRFCKERLLVSEKVRAAIERAMMQGLVYPHGSILMPPLAKR